MLVKYYLFAAGDDTAISALHSSLNVSGSEVRDLKCSLSDEKLQRKKMWCSPYRICATPYPEDEFADFFEQNPRLVQGLKAHSDSLDEVALMVVCELTGHEHPHGFSISSKLISQLSEVKASLELDFVPQLDMGPTAVTTQ